MKKRNLRAEILEGLRHIKSGGPGIRPEMAIRLSIAFKTSAESWLNQQVQYDLWRAEKLRKTLRVSRLGRDGDR